MNDKERILMQIIEELRTTTTLGPYGKAHAWGSENFKGDRGSGCYVHFAPWVEHDALKKGDLVLCQTGGISDFKIGFVHEVLDYGRCLIREIGSDRICDYGNEKFVPIIGLSKTQLLEGDKYLFYQKVLKAFRRGDEYIYRFGGVDIKDGEAVIWIREVFGGALSSRDKGTKPFSVQMKWNNKTSIKAILTAMREGGYGTRKFERWEEEPYPAR